MGSRVAIGWTHALIAMGLFASAWAPAFGIDVLNPYFTAKDILPAEMNGVPGIGGMGLLPNGDGVI
jgi:hypothetical protein